ncbi:hypothetical protein TNCV_988181 [Trichonephila clavipes]|nr:hypothetical protein TNCV_988181 [Trichonephila clavipes]
MPFAAEWNVHKTQPPLLRLPLPGNQRRLRRQWWDERWKWKTKWNDIVMNLPLLSATSRRSDSSLETTWRLLPNSTDKFRWMIECSTGTTNQHRTWGRKPPLDGENFNNSSRPEDDESDKGNCRKILEFGEPC